MNKNLTIDGPEELLRNIPILLGYNPINKLVAVGLSQNTNKVEITVALDIVDFLKTPNSYYLELRSLIGNLAKDGLGGKSVVIFAYDPQAWPYDIFSFSLKAANENYLLKKDILALEDHPADQEIVNGICMNQGTYAMAMCQSLSDLNVKAKHMASKGFYDAWPEEYLTALFQHRKDPRK